MRLRRASLALVPLAALAFFGGSVAGCDEPEAAPAATAPGVLPSAFLDRTTTFHTDGSAGLDGRITLVFEEGVAAQHLEVRGVHIDEPGKHVWAVDSVGFLEGAPIPGDPFAEQIAGVVTFHAHAADAGSATIGKMPMVPPGTVVLDVVLNGQKTALVPLLNQQEILADVCEAPPLEPVAVSLDASVAWSAATLPNLVVDTVDVAADASGRAYLLGSYHSGGENQGVRLFAIADGHIGSVAELPTNVAALAPGEGAGPSVAMRTHPGDGTIAITVSRRNVGVAEVWSRSITAPIDVGLPAIATSGGRVLVGMTVTSPLTIDGVVDDAADADPEQLVVFDAETGVRLASKGGVHATRAEALAGGAFVVTTDDASGAFTRVLEADLTERWKIVGTGALATTTDGRVFVALGSDVHVFAADGAPLGVVPHAGGPTLAPLADGSILVERLDGVARVRPDGTVKWASLPAAKVDWCTATPPFLVARVDGGAILAARPETPQDGSSAGRAIVARFEAAE